MNIKGIDTECSNLCVAINKIPGIYTVESCCGHGERPYHIWFQAKGLRFLPRLLYYFDGCHCGFYGWKIVAQTDCGMSPVCFMIEGPVGNEAYQQAEYIAQLLEEEAKIERR